MPQSLRYGEEALAVLGSPARFACFLVAEREPSPTDMVCGSCGLVLGDRIIDTRSEWRTFFNDDQGNDDPSRVGDSANPLLNGPQLETGISYGDGGSGRQKW